MTGMAPTRPVLRYHGGKWRLAPWIIEHLPPHEIYCEAFGGAASVLLRKPRSPIEVYNDRDGEVVNVFRVLRDPHQARDLGSRLRLTPYARDEFLLSYEPCGDPVEQARRTIVRAWMAFGTTGVGAAQHRTGFRACTRGSSTNPVHSWSGLPNHVRAWCERFNGVCIENRDALEVIEQQDAPQTLFYLDPPYLPETRTAKRTRDCYRHELDVEGHEKLLQALQRVAGMVVLSAYPASLYRHMLRSWHCIERDTIADGARQRRECLWLNSAAERSLSVSPRGLFPEVDRA